MSDSLREAFKAAHKHLDLSENKDAWGEPVFAHSHVDAMWSGWKAALSAPQADAEGMIKLRPNEIQSGLDRVKWAEGLIRQLPENHDGRNSWLLNYAGQKHEADKFTAMTAPSNPREALEECISVLELVEQPAIRDTDHTEEVHALGERMGYGALMSAASAEWRASLEDDGLPTGGEFVAGPCYATVLATLKKAREALSRADEGKESEGGHESRVAAVSCEIPTQRSGESRDPLGDGSVNTSPHREDAAGVAPGPSDPKPWPNGCRNPNSCAIHRDCMYVGCTNYDRDISGEVDAALLRGGA